MSLGEEEETLAIGVGKGAGEEEKGVVAVELSTAESIVAAAEGADGPLRRQAEVG
jgi:hypothetical protein